MGMSTSGASTSGTSVPPVPDESTQAPETKATDSKPVEQRVEQRAEPKTPESKEPKAHEPKTLESKASDTPAELLSLVRELKSDIDSLKKSTRKVEDDSLAEQGKWKELAEKRATELRQAEAKLERSIMRSALARSLSASLPSPVAEELANNISTSKMSVDADGRVTGVSDAIEEYKRNNPSVFAALELNVDSKNTETKTSQPANQSVASRLYPSSPSPGNPSPSPSTPTKRATEMTDEEYSAYIAKITGGRTSRHARRALRTARRAG